MKITGVFILLFLTSGLLAQNSIDVFLLDRVNHLRDSIGVQRLSLDNVLKLAAEDHVFYISEKNKLTHFQKTFRKETPYERVIFYKGNRTYVGENVASVPPASKNDPLKLQKTADSLFKAWYNSPKHYENMIYPHYTKMGVSTRKSSNGNIYGVQVFSSDQIRLPHEFKNPEFSWGVRPSEFTCKDEPVVYETMFFANRIVQYGDSIFFEFHDMEFFKNVIKGDNDGMAIDIVLREQLPCHKENQFHSSSIYDGEMQEPIYKYDLFKNNRSGNPKKILVKVGYVPKYLSNKQWDANVIIINDNKLCDYSIPVEVPSAIIPLIPHKIYHEKDTNANNNSQPVQISISDTFHLELFYERREEKFSAYNMDELIELSKWQDYIQRVNVACFASVEGKRWMNNKLLAERHNTVSELIKESFPQVNSVKIDTAENWDMMYEQIESYNLSVLQNRSQKEIKLHFKKNKTPLYDSLLFAQRSTHLYAYFDTTLMINSSLDYYVASQFDSTVTLSSLNWNQVLADDYILGHNYLPEEIVDSIWEQKHLRSNLYGAMIKGYTYRHIDSTLILGLLNDGTDENNSIQTFNYASFLTEYWFSRYSRSYATKGVATTREPEAIFELTKTIDTTIIDWKDLRLLQINILLSGIHYYVAHNEWEKKNEYFDRIRSLLDEDLLTPEEATDLALFCNHFHKFKIAVDILAPYHDIQNLHEDGLFVLAKTATLIRDILDPDTYFQFMMSAKKANPSRYCNWLDDQFQIQRIEEIKVDFCKSCN